MKKFLLAMCVSMAVVMMVAPVSAMELWDPHLRGSSEGGAAGALPPAGFYFVNEMYMMPGLQLYDDSGSQVGGHRGTDLFVFVEIPTLLWSTGCKFLGADYGMALVEPVVYTNLRVGQPGESLAGDNWGTFNTLLVPYILSWKLPCDWRIKTALAIGFNDGSSTLENSALAGSKNPNINNHELFVAPSANDYYSFIPEIGISWLHAGWNVSADFRFSFETKNTYTDYQSGDAFYADYTITRTFGKWTFGLGACQYNQVDNDKGIAVAGGPSVSLPGTKTTMYTMGPIIGYNFGPCSLTFTYNFALYSQDQFGGDFCFLTLVVPLGNPFK